MRGDPGVSMGCVSSTRDYRGHSPSRDSRGRWGSWGYSSEVDAILVHGWFYGWFSATACRAGYYPCSPTFWSPAARRHQTDKDTYST